MPLDHDERFDKALDRLEEISAQAERIKEVEEGFDEKMDAINKRFEELFGLEKALDSLLKKTGSSLDDIHASLRDAAELVNRLSAIEEKLEKLNLPELKAKLDATESAVEKSADKVIKAQQTKDKAKFIPPVKGKGKRK